MCFDDTSSNSTEERFPIKFIDMGLTYAKSLYDVDGKLLVNSQGEKMNIYRKEFNDELTSKRIRLLHRIKTPSYRYFITSEEQRIRFLTEREEGSKSPFIRYYVYVDEDTDKTHTDYTSVFTPYHLDR